MAISDYSELLAAVPAWFERSGDADVAAHVAEWVALGEAKLNRKLKGLRVSTIDATLTGTIGSRNIDLPSDYLTPVSLHLTTGGKSQLLRPMALGTMNYRTSSGSPSAWGVDRFYVVLDAPCDQAHTFQFRYHQALDLQGANFSAGWLLDVFPDAYLYATLEAGAVYFKDIPAAQGYGGLLAEIIDEIKAHNSANYKAVLTTDPALMASGNLSYADFVAGDF